MTQYCIVCVRAFMRCVCARVYRHNAFKVPLGQKLIMVDFPSIRQDFWVCSFQLLDDRHVTMLWRHRPSSFQHSTSSLHAHLFCQVSKSVYKPSDDHETHQAQVHTVTSQIKFVWHKANLTWKLPVPPGESEHTHYPSRSTNQLEHHDPHKTRANRTNRDISSKRSISPSGRANGMSSSTSTLSQNWHSHGWPYRSQEPCQWQAQGAVH